MTTINQAISSVDDDGQAGSGAGYNKNGGTVTIGGYFGTANAWFRFPSTGIPEGATITAATLTFLRNPGAGGLADIIYYGNKATSPSVPTSDSDYNSKAVTTASVTHNSQSGTSGTYTSPSLVSIVQELVDQTGFSGTIMLLVKDNNSNANHGGFENRITAYTLDSGNGTYATLNVTYSPPPAKITADAGSFTMSGQTANIKATYKITADAGTFTLSGQTANIKAAIKFVCDAGSFTLSGQTASTVTSINAAAGTFTLSGQSAVVKLLSRFTADAGTFTETGYGATFTPVVPIIASAPGTNASASITSTWNAGGTFKLRLSSTSDSSLFYQTPFAGDIAYDGSDGNLLGSLIQSELNTAIAAMGMTGFVTATVTITDPTPSFTTGTITFSPRMPWAVAVAAQTANGTGGLSFFTVDDGTSGFIVAGQPAGFRYSTRIVAAADSFTLTGQDAEFSIAINKKLPLLSPPKARIFLPEIPYDTTIDGTLVRVKQQRFLTGRLQYGITMTASPLLVHPPRRMAVSPYFPVETAAAYVENSKQKVIMGSADGFFKFNKTARSVQGGVLHLGPVKPSIQTQSALFTILVNVPYIPAGGFRYEAPGGYLIITNPDPIEIMLVQDDSGNGYVGMQPVTANPPVLVSDFYQ